MVQRTVILPAIHKAHYVVRTKLGYRAVHSLHFNCYKGKILLGVLVHF
jgi:hypothetical protein